MGRCAILLLLGLAGCVAPGAPESAGSRALFDGRSLTGWEGDERFWRVEDGAIVGESAEARPCARTTYLAWTGGEVEDFELTLSWRLAGGNSGVQFRSRVSSPEEVAGYQADLEAGPDWTGGLYEQDGRGVVTRRGERVVLDAQGGKTAERFADAGALLAGVAAGEWNELRVVAFGPRLTIEVNGRLFSETIDLDPERAARRGRIALQLHAGPAMRVEYRELFLRSLAPPLLAGGARSPWDVAGSPEWIWVDEAAEEGEIAWFRRVFELADVPARAELWASCDNHFDAWLNGAGVATSDDWEAPVRADVRAALRAGENELVVRGQNDGGPAALALELVLEDTAGPSLLVASDGSWDACVQDPAAAPAEHELRSWLDARTDWTSAHSFGPLDTGPWRSAVGPSGGSAPGGETIAVPPGFRVELLHSVDLENEGSWVALAVDPAGRLYASDQYGGVFCITPLDRGSDARARVQRLALPLGEAHGLLWAFDALYAVVSGAGEHASGLYRARDADGDGELDTVELLRPFDGDGEHGPHAVLAHPDGRSLVVVGGNHTELPGPFERSLLPPSWGEDALLPFLYDPNGHAVGIRAPGGWIARTDPDGRSWALVAAGFRNTYDAAFSSDGELFTYDSDMEWDVGLPWYKPTRVLHVTSGAEFGWRSGSANWPADAYDALPAAVDLGLGSPTGIVFGEGTSFPAPWKRALFACDWAYGRIFAVFLEPEGSSYRGRHEVFASGEPFPVTDVVVGPDGALYVTTGGRQTQSGLYRIAWEGAEAAVGEERPDAGADARELRRRLEEFHGDGERASEAVPLALEHLGDADRFVRYAARIALEHRPPALWAADVLAEREPRRALEGVLALVRSDPAADAELVVERAALLFEQSSGRAERLDALRLLELALIRLELGGESAARLSARLERAYPTGDERLDRTLLGLCVHLDADVARRALARLEAAETQEERIAILYALRALDAGWSEADARRFLAALEREIETATGGASVRGYLEALRDEALEHLDAERLDSGPLDSGPLDSGPLDSELGTPAVTLGPALTAPRSGVPQATRAWTMAELEGALTRVARGRSFEGGRAAYAAGSCHTCHRMDGAGENEGPDLTGASGRYSARDLLLAILEPSREVPDVWRDTELWCEDELLAVGRLEERRADAVVVREASGSRVSVPVEYVLEEKPHPLSRMPEGLLDVLDEDGILDLLAYVLAGGDPADERFAGR